MTVVRLAPHPDTPAAWVDSLQVEVASAPGLGLTLAYRLRGDLARLRLPPRTAPGRADGLWRHACLEAFVMGEDAPAYREYNLSPSGAWQAYAFRAWREGGAAAPAADPGIACRAMADRLTLTASLAAADLPPGRRLRLALSAVLEDAAGGLSYWALRHPPGRPDFHHPDAFALELDRP